MRDAQEAEFTDFEDQLKQAKFASCQMVDLKVAIDSSSKTKQQDKHMK